MCSSDLAGDVGVQHAGLKAKAAHRDSQHGAGHAFADAALAGNDTDDFLDTASCVRRLMLRRAVIAVGLAPWMTELVWRMLACWGYLSGSKPAFTRETARSSQHCSRYSNARILSLYPDFHFYPDRKSTRLNSSHANESRMPSSA